MDLNAVIENFHFWLYFLSTSFPESLDSETDETLAEFLAAHYDCEAAQEWADDFVQCAAGTVNDDGYAENPTMIEVPLQGVTLAIAFHPGDTIFYLDGQEIGCTGPHYQIRCISASEFLSLIDGIECRKAALLLPLVSVHDNEREQVCGVIQMLLEILRFHPYHHQKIAKLILFGIVS